METNSPGAAGKKRKGKRRPERSDGVNLKRDSTCDGVTVRQRDGGRDVFRSSADREVSPSPQTSDAIFRGRRVKMNEPCHGTDVRRQTERKGRFEDVKKRKDSSDPSGEKKSCTLS